MKHHGMIVTCLTLSTLAAAGSGALLPDNGIALHRRELTRSTSPHNRWEFFMKAPRDEEHEPTMWIAQTGGKQIKLLGPLYRDGHLEWCPDDSCLLLLEEPSIENVRLKLYRLGTSGPEAIPTLDRAIRDNVQESSGRDSQILFYALQTVGWTDSRHVLIAAQARYVKRSANAPAEIFAAGYIVDAESGKIDRRLSANDLKSKYGFSKRMV